MPPRGVHPAIELAGYTAGSDHTNSATMEGGQVCAGEGSGTKGRQILVRGAISNNRVATPGLLGCHPSIVAKWARPSPHGLSFPAGFYVPRVCVCEGLQKGHFLGGRAYRKVIF